MVERDELPSIFLPATVSLDDPYYNGELFQHWYMRGPVRYRLMPPTHHTYRLLDRSSLQRNPELLLIGGGLDALLALAVLSAFLFFHPRRKPPDDAPT